METITGEEIQARLEKRKGIITKRFKVLEIGLFGSFINGSATPESDIDILVQFQKGHKDFFNYMRLKKYLEDELHRSFFSLRPGFGNDDGDRFYPGEKTRCREI